MDSSNETLNLVREVLLDPHGNSEESFQNALSRLGSVVSESSQSEPFRQALATDPLFPTYLYQIIEESFKDHVRIGISPDASPQDAYYLRIFRGVVLLVRNLASVSEFKSGNSSPQFVKSILESILRCDGMSLLQGIENQNVDNLLVSYLQTLANLTTEPVVQTNAPVETINEVVGDDEELETLKLFGGLLPITDRYPRISSELNFPLAILMSNKLASNSSIYKLLSDTELSGVMLWLIEKFESMDTDNELSESDKILLVVAQRIISHESYSKWLSANFDYSDFKNDRFVSTMKFNQIIVTSRDDWDNFETTAILAWEYEYFKIFADLTKAILPKTDYDPSELSYIHTVLVTILDSISDLGKLLSTKQFLEHYNAMEILVSLLRVVHENIERKTLKKRKIEEVESEKTAESTKHFPQVKSLIIEIISYLAHDSFEMQEKVRTLHGLELVLSNCMIDDNDPFIKERAIICTKILLDKNPLNQQFVADLEAKQSVDDDALREVGYEVEIEDGKVKLRKSAADEPAP